jgi:hypothetical protein
VMSVDVAIALLSGCLHVAAEARQGASKPAPSGAVAMDVLAEPVTSAARRRQVRLSIKGCSGPQHGPQHFE